MFFRMATTKITITVDDDQLRDIHALVAAGQTPSVSGFVKHARGDRFFPMWGGGTCWKMHCAKRVVH